MEMEYLKIQSSIEGMKMDMAGGATVLGVFKLLAELKPNLHVIGIVPAVENLVGGNAYKPDDILTAYNGKTIEITNTDAEGRLILADSIAYGVKKYKPECIVDLATLTGACITALGYTRAGLFTNNTQLRSKFVKASKITGSKTWPLPIDDIHREKVKGEISDYKNYTGGIGAGSTMAAAFLEKFVEETPWAHLDIAGVAFLPSEIGYRPKGATGEPVKLIYKFLEQY
jgi:leucyl aminopeptidase